ncbi:MAG TPA: glycosyltransferase family 4 protein [Ramlibacter sp.]|jgi:glycosyltransferase involved in cell wall biosynthesis|uniref:glycosyltransferase family 4 protein n=1 Tax=Ramlibacter sp. TaxID=1917967 RepID=UPI002D5E23C6|nr:glycosyltransferase family 4 protein [Ramlibacter sp.]HZY20174.1 glycosyltransferase family 4 protein [Ramlibacter sp.]
MTTRLEPSPAVPVGREAGDGSPSPGAVAVVPQSAPSAQGRFIYLAGPCTPMGGGMFKVAQYLADWQQPTPGGPVLRLLETRGGGRALWSPLHLARAVGALVRGRASGRLAGVHVNVAERLSLVRKAVIMSACRLLRIPVVLHLHAAQLRQNYEALPAPAQAFVRWMFTLPASCVVLGRSAADFVTRELRVPPERVEIIINGVPEPTVPRRPAMPAVAKVLFLGNLSDRKGVPDLLQAMAHPALADVPLELTLAGGGDASGYAAQALDLGIADRVHFHGWATGEQVTALLSQSDVMVLPSHDEGLPLAILESLAQGVAVVCTPVGEIPNVLSHGHSACFVEPGNPASIARGLAQVLTDPQLRERLERNGRMLYQERFSMPQFAAQVARVHQREFGLSAPAPTATATARP